MTLVHRSSLVAGILALAAGFAPAGAGTPSSARSPLAVPDANPPVPDASGSLQVKFFPENAHRSERTWVRLRAKRLEKKSDYTMWVDDPAVDGDDFVAWEGTVTTHGKGNVNFRVDTKKGGTLPFGKSAQDLAGASFQLRAGDGGVVLEGSFPTLPTP